MTIIKLSRTPPSTQNIYFHRGHIVFMSKEGKLCKELYQWEIKSQYKGKILEEDLSVEIRFYFKDKKRRDIDNYNKLVLDACTDILWKDDKQIKTLLLKMFVDKLNPRVELIIH